MGRPIVSVSLSMLMLTSLLCIIPPMASADQPGEIVEPICNANRNDTWTVGLIYCDDRVNEDYTLFAPMSSASTYLIDSHGREIHSWTSSSGLRPGLSAYVLEDGDLLRTANIGTDGGGSFSGGGIAGKVERLSWDSQIEWEWYYVGDSRRSHHDIEPLPNGNLLMIAWGYKSETDSQDAGRDPDKMSQNALWPDHIIEVEPSGTNQGTVVWEWHIWDHLIQDFDSTKDNYGIVADHPELLDINFADASGPNKYKSDWMHCNGIDYNPTLDQIALSCKNTNEIYIIDHSTSTEEAASHSGGNSGKGGDILYRWGNPEAYRAGTPEDQQLFGQHDIQWIQEGRPGAGDLSLFNNGVGRSTSYSSVDVISPPLVNGEYVIESGSAWGPEAPNWTWDQGTDMYGTSISGAERLENGNTLVTWGQRGTFYEVNLEGEIVWEYINPVIGNGPMNQGETIPQGQNANSQQNTVFKTHRYNSSFAGFIGKDLTPGDYIESWTDNCNKEESIPWDSDGDGCIDDTDGDGVKDNADICPGFDDSIDVDADSIPDGCDDLVDSDQDGVDNSQDTCPGFDDSIDVDADGVPDGCDDILDSDGDGVSDEMDVCPGFDDAIDVDADGVSDGCDSLIDSDGDGVSDEMDVCNNHDDAIDIDDDGITDGCDSLIDSDGDEVSDAEDICDGFDDSIDVDADGIADGCDSLIDSDGDGVSDTEDQCAGFNDTIDQDDDGIPDDCDQTPLPIEEQTNVTEQEPTDDSESTVAQDSGSSGSKMNAAVIVAVIGLLIVFISAVRLLLMRSPQEGIEWASAPPLDVFAAPTPEHYPPEPTQPVDALPQMEAVVQGPPLPATGLPAGWTMEQWQHYGQQYLDDLAGHNNG
ncbi:MAG: aryl-sulfate sulfotransferase [Candidatus Thalassarchaeaceae archaeon]|nr:aryl-sulfate sulfotransferase [Candidatus Thalassarchaeaceae archaeon]